MKSLPRTAIVLFAVIALSSVHPRADMAPPAKAAHVPTMAQFMSAAFPMGLVAARKIDRIAWISNDKGLRNVYTAAAPDFRPVRVTSFMKDDGVDTTQLSISDDGSIVSFTRGHDRNRLDWVASPEADPKGVERALWAARTAAPGIAWRLAEGSSGVLSPDGRYVAYAQNGQIFRVPTVQGARANDVDKGLKPFIKIWGTNSNPMWSPDGRKIAFISRRTDHSFIAIYDLASRKVSYLSPSVDFDSSPTWSPDSKRVAFIRRPGTPFALQSQEGVGGLGNPPGPAFSAAAAARGGGAGRGGGGGGGGQGRGGRGGEQTPPSSPTPAPRPGLTTATFGGGYTLSFWVADVATGDAQEFWHNAKDEKVFNAINSIAWEGDHVVFQLEPEEWTRFYAVPVRATGPVHNTGPNARTDIFGPMTTPSPVPEPISLTPQEGQIESASFSSDGKYLYYGTNATDIERRHIWRVPTAGGTPQQITNGEGIEHDPAVLPSGRIAVLSADYRRPQSVAVFPAAMAATMDASAQKVLYPVLTKEFPTDAHVKPEIVITKAPDGMEIHNQLFLPKDLRSGEKRPAIIFVHGGPVRQMLPGYHYMEVYHLFYGVNQWLASQGYIVMSVNYRGGIGYGKSFRTAPNTNSRGNAEYQDVLAGGRYLQSRPDVDPKRVGIWGLSYGGLLTAQALARNSDVFIAGVDLAGVHLYGNNLDPENLAYKSSAISAIDQWKSPVLLIHGDDDRNVNFAQTVGLVQLLRAHDVPYELYVMPDDTHETLLYKRWLPMWERMETFLNKYLKKEDATSTSQQK
ncbi:MAG TPA: prolyl oligopeptidase family serine peptidase [Vicinamibacterales bacterium]|nr:prolyl oligopeptidase family serine peptidase [Vicinamibacterales bacterium]